MHIAFLTSCITPFEPEISEKNINKYVISGDITDNRELQAITVSTASSVNDPHYIPLSGCTVRILDDRGNVFMMKETGSIYNSSRTPGIYSGNIGRSYLIPGVSFKVEVITPDGEKIESDFDRMNECPDVDSVYSDRKDLVSFSGETTKGLQFYIDVDGRETVSGFFRWELFETWEYHVPYPREWYYDGRVHHIFPPDFSRKVCWSTEMIKNIYTLSTTGLSENKYERYPLHFVSNRTQRLAYGYSLLINQISLSEAAFTYWDQLRINSSNPGGLYEKQPLPVTGNLHNLNDPEQEVLGFFSVSSVRSKRIFIRNVPDLVLDFDTFCSPAALLKGLAEIGPEDYPAFLMGDEKSFYMVHLSNNCVDCLTLGGTNIKPDFWPN